MHRAVALPLFATALASVASASPATLDLLSYDAPPLLHATPAGPPTGASMELVTELFRRVRQPVRVQVYPLARALMQVRHGASDGLFGITKTADLQREFVYASRPLFWSETVLFVRSTGPVKFSGDLNALNGQRVGLRRGARYGRRFDRWLAHQPYRAIQYADSAEASILKLMAGRVDVVVDAKASGWAMVDKFHARDRVRLAGAVVERIPVYLAWSRRCADTRLIRDIDAALSAMERDGTALRIRRKYGLL